MTTADRNLDLTVTARYRYHRIQELLVADLSPPADIVEFGAAPGDQIVGLARIGFRATALDIGVASDAWGTGEEGRMRRILTQANVRFVEWNLEQTPYPLASEAFDVVIMTEVLEHLRDYPSRALEEARRVLKPAGRLYLTTPNAAYLMNRLRLMSGRSVATPLADWIGGLPHARHAREYTVAEMFELMSAVGLRVVHLESRHFFVSDGSIFQRCAKTVIDRVSRVRPTLGPTIVVIAGR